MLNFVWGGLEKRKTTLAAQAFPAFPEWIGQLYGFEEEYKLQDLPPEEIKRRRNDDRTTDIMIAMSTRLNELLLDENAHLGDMMQKALRYLNKFWKQLFTITLYHTFIAARPLDACMARTCQMMGMSVLKYFKSLFSEIAKGRIDYERSALPLVPVRVSRICCPWQFVFARQFKKQYKNIVPIRTESSLFELCRMQPIFNNH